MLATLWGPHFPVVPAQIALEYSRQRFKSDPIAEVTPHTISGFEGALIKSAEHSHWYVLYAPWEELPGRENFTVAHELGHYLLHRTRADKFECGQEEVIDNDGYRYKKQEQEANTFASYLLMPMNDFREQVRGQEISLDLLGHCADRYRVSFLAAALKWIEFTMETALLVVATDGFALWSKPSQKAEQKHLWWKFGREIPKNAVIAEPSTRGRPDPVTHPPGVWSYYDPTIEMAIMSDRYDFQIALILFPDTSIGPRQYDPEPEDSFDFFASKQ